MNCCTKAVPKVTFLQGLYATALLATLPLFAFVPAAVAADESCLRRSVLVMVLDSSGNPVTDLTAADIQAEFRGQPVTIHSAEFAVQPARVIVLLDASGSVMHRAGKWRFFRQTAENIGTTLPNEFSLGLVVFAAETLLQVSTDNGREAFLAVLRDLPADRKGVPTYSKRTSIRDAIVEGVKLLEPVQRGDSLYLITDGGENQSRAGRRDVEDRLLHSGVRLFVLVLRFDQFEGLIDANELVQQQQMRDLATSSGGHAAFFPSRDFSNLGFGPTDKTYQLSEIESLVLETILRKLYMPMVASYRLELELPRLVDKPRKWKLQVVGSDGKVRKGLTVAFPGKLLPCVEPNSPVTATSP